MNAREKLLAKIKKWDGVNKYIVRKARKELRELDEQPQVEEEKPDL